MTRLAAILSTGFGVGYFPFAPGTAASLATLPFGYAIAICCGSAAVLGAGIAVFVIGIWAAGSHARSINEDDPGTSVIDEIAGQLIALSAVEFAGSSDDLMPLLLAFALFRFFDVLKPWPIWRLERLGGGVGIMADDLAAGAVSGILIWIAAG